MLYTDQLGRTITITKPLKRIVSLVPSQTELLVDLGLEEKIVGITKFCVHPLQLREQKTVIGGTKTVSYKKIASLEPDIILCNKEENTAEIVTTLAAAYIVHVSNIESLSDALVLIEMYGQLFHCRSEAEEMIQKIKKKAKNHALFMAHRTKLKAIYFIWKNPWMTVGKDTFIHHLMALNGFDNVFAGSKRYPELTSTSLANITVDVVLLSSEPFPFKEKHIQEVQTLLPDSKIILVDGEYFSWYGSRLIKAFNYFREVRENL